MVAMAIHSIKELTENIKRAKEFKEVYEEHKEVFRDIRLDKEIPIEVHFLIVELLNAAERLKEPKMLYHASDLYSKVKGW